MTCTFFGHRDTPQAIQPKLEKVLIDLIEHNSADNFYVGNQGAFDHIVRRTLQSLKTIYPHIRYSIVLAYMPGKRRKDDYYEYSDTIYLEGLESTPPKYAISKRNRWMIEHSDAVITYVKCTIGGAAQFQKLAERKGKRIINISL